jgi:uncharacterized iron-regulated membrane protein
VKPTTVRQLYAWHKWTGLITGLFLFLLSVSGAVAVFKEEIDRLLTPARVVTAQQTRLPLDAVIEQVRGYAPDQKISGVQFNGRPDSAMTVRMEDPNMTGGGQFYEIFVDPYTGRVTGERRGENVANVIRQLHVRFYYFGVWGRVAVGVFGLAMLISSVTGLIIYAPFMKGVFAQGLHFWQIRRAPGAQKWNLWNSDWHKLAGIVSLVFNLIIGLTGAVLGLENLSRYSKPVDDAIHPRPLPNRRPGKVELSPDEALVRAEAALPAFEARSIIFPTAKNNQYTIYGDLAGRFERANASFLTIDAANGAALHTYSASTTRPVTKLYNLSEPLHFGDFAGTSLKIIYVLFGLVGSFLTVTGFVLWRLKNRRPARAPKPLLTSTPSRGVSQRVPEFPQK